MILTSLFVVTMTITILVTFKLIAIIFGQSMSLPLVTYDIDLAKWYIMYPSVGFQIWFWFTHYGILPL